MMIWLMACRGLYRNIRRTLAIILTIGVGAGALFSFQGFNVGIMDQYRYNTIHAHYGYGQINTHGYVSTVYEKPWDHWIDHYSDLSFFLNGVAGVQQAFPRVSFHALLTNGEVTVSGFGHGIDGEREATFFHALNVVEGESLSTQADGILLGQGLARALDVKPGHVVTVLGNTIRGSLNALDLKVVGIFHTGSKEFDDRVFRIPLAQAQQLLDTTRIESVALALTSLEAWDSVATSIQSRYPDLEATSFAVLDKVFYQHSVDWLSAQFRIIQIIIVLMVVLGIFNATSTAILERRQEIGCLRANGDSRRQVMFLLCIEGMTTAAIGAVMGLMITWMINSTLLAKGILMPPAPGLTRQFHVLIQLQGAHAVSTFVMCIVAAAAATLAAGYRVVRQPIGELLRAV